jgi:hypothetical protein
MKIPSNIITTGKYTIGGEFINKKTHRPYQGYYYELGNGFFAGKEFNSNAPEIIKIQSAQTNNLLLKASTYTFGLLSRVKIPNLTSIPSIISTGNINGQVRYFSKKNNTTPILIREITKETFNDYQNNPLYQTISITFPEGGYFGEQQSLDDAEKIMPGIKAFILAELPPD